MCCIFSSPSGNCEPSDTHFISRIASEDSCKCITGEERVFILKGDKVLEYSQKTGEITETDLRLVKPDYVAAAKKKIDEICSKIKYESNASKPYKTESYIFNEVANNNVSDLIKSDIDISSIKIKPVMDFLVNIGADEINKLKQAQNYDDEDLDTATICTIGIKMFLKSGAPEEVLALKRMILITHLVMQKVSELKAAVSPRKDPDTNDGEQKDSAA